MREDYMPNEKYRNMFGVERNGYGMERVDLYLAQLEVAFKKIREDNRNLKRELSEQPTLQPQAMGGLLDNGGAAQLAAAQEQYIAQLQAQLGDQQAQLSAAQEQNQRLLAQLNDQSTALPQPQQQAADLMNQIAALRAEADELRQQLRRQPPQPNYPPAPANYPPVSPAFSDGYAVDNRHDLIGKVLVDARAQADEMKRSAKQEAETVTRKARQQVDELRAERERIHTQLQGISYALRNVLREAGDSDYKSKDDDILGGRDL